MGDLLRDGLNWLEQQRMAHMTSPVIYRRAGSGGQAGVPHTGPKGGV
jgi:hypothetical protein